MDGCPTRLPRWFLLGLLFAAGLLRPAATLAQDGPISAPTSDNATSNAEAPGSQAISDLLKLDIEQLAKAPVVVPSMDIPVTSVTKETSTVGRSAAAVFVITNEMIRRSGATCIPEALRMAPGLEVARVNSNTWAITARGFNNSLANKLLVLIDGRTVYSPVFSGTYWDVQDVVLEDVERIEVIRGPGGTLWGANAVNGVISVITKNAADTQGAYMKFSGGSVERSSETARYGGKIGDDGYYRVYGKYFDRGPFYDPTQPANDAWTQGRFGFRSDWSLDKAKIDTVTLQGDHYVGQSGMSAGFTSFTDPHYQIRNGDAYNTGENVLARWRHVYSDDSDWTLQSYFDNFERDTILNSERVRTFDIDFQYRFPLNDRHQIICGAGYRYIHDQLPSTSPLTLSAIPTERSYYIASQFLQDEITLSPDLWTLTLGCKLEQNAFTYFEYQPTARLLYTPDNKHSLWGAVSRAVHTPSRVDENLFSTTPFEFPPGNWLYTTTIGNEALRSETLLAYEFGYRVQATDRFSYDFTTFYNVYDNLRSADFIGVAYPFYFFQLDNGPTADSVGAELATTWKVSDRWQLSANYTYLVIAIHGDSVRYGDGNSPCNQVYVRSSWNVRENVDFDLMARYVDRLVDLEVPSYIEMDLRLAWRPRKQLELALVGQNLLQTYHYEFGRTVENYAGQLTEVPRGVYGTITWRR